MAFRFVSGHFLQLALLILALGITSVTSLSVSLVALKNSTTTPSNSTDVDAVNVVDPGSCGDGEVLLYSYCGCNNLITSICWTPNGGFFGSKTNYTLACGVYQQCMPSINSASTAKCVDPADFRIINVDSTQTECAVMNQTAYGSIQAVTQIIGGCPPPKSSYPFYAKYYYTGDQSLICTKYPSNYWWLSDAFQARDSFETCIPPMAIGVSIQIAVAVTSQITDSCPQCP